MFPLPWWERPGEGDLQMKHTKKKETKKAAFLKFNTIKEYIVAVLKMRSNEDAVNKLIQDIDSTIENIINDAGKLAQENKRTTILEQDIIQTLEKYLGKKHLTWQEISAEIVLQTPADLGKISAAIKDYIEKNQGKKINKCKKWIRAN